MLEEGLLGLVFASLAVGSAYALLVVPNLPRHLRRPGPFDRTPPRELAGR